MVWSSRKLVLLIEFVDMDGKSPPVRLATVQLQFDFGDFWREKPLLTKSLIQITVVLYLKNLTISAV